MFLLKMTLAMIVLVPVLLLFSGCLESATPVDDGTVHVHADFALFLNGQKFDFAQEKYMTDKDGKELSKLVHLHDMDGDVIHVHAPSITLGMFFESLGMKLETKTNESEFQGTCFTDDEGNEYCSWSGPSIPEEPTLMVIVNGKTLTEKPEDYVIQDLDQILVTYKRLGDDLTNQIAEVTDKACIQSEKCPERGKPTEGDSCAGSGECGTGNIPTV